MLRVDHCSMMVFRLNEQPSIPMQRVLGLTWRPRRMRYFVDQTPEEISKNDGNTI